jgi:cytidine deaminase
MVANQLRTSLNGVNTTKTAKNAKRLSKKDRLSNFALIASFVAIPTGSCRVWWIAFLQLLNYKDVRVNAETFNLIGAARKVWEKAHAPYSKFAVGADRNTVQVAIAVGCRDFTQIATVAEVKKPARSCSECRQVIVEFSPDNEAVTSNLEGDILTVKLAELLPGAQTGIFA